MAKKSGHPKGEVGDIPDKTQSQGVRHVIPRKGESPQAAKDRINRRVQNK